MYCTTNYPIPYELWIYVIDMMEQPELELFLQTKSFFLY
ncbi:ankyrin-containing protein [Acanthamoeba castellanii mimivirus]|uniref:Ankyrin-containing protein n=1 Tax=Acanthamoeba castellanii mimivirus TaxID=1899318 RepID=A0A1E1EXA5_9VIRU|nr:ankyrin-containing protein [Acanthamoeba polyphaga mimivirus]BAV61914.1 ankyrin-containing protein [Acanthamoeba castellanii mimivirus]BAV62900.1 ankyrin-containing protein [Acanthamoeba castellanii mimivirus]